MLTLTTGTIFVMWLGEQITDRGVGNGISLLIFAGIVIGLPRGVQQVSERLQQRRHAGDSWSFRLAGARWSQLSPLSFLLKRRGRKVPVELCQARMWADSWWVDSKPLCRSKINMGGVIPVIFASSVLSMPQSLFAAFPPNRSG